MTSSITRPPIRVLVVDDSPTVRSFLCWMVEQAGFEVAGAAGSVSEAEQLVHRLKPDLVLSDVHLQDGDGIELTRRLLAERGVPIILITGHDPTNPDLVFRAMEAGALEVLAKPPAVTSPEFQAYQKSFATSLKSLAGTPIIRRRPRPTVSGSKVESQVAQLPSAVERPVFTAPPIVAIAASTGGPLLVGDLLKAVPQGSVACVLVVQHIVPEFADSFRTWLGEYSGRQVRTAESGRAPVSGGFYTAPPNCHIQLHRDGTFRTLPARSLPSPHVPSADAMFESLADACAAEVLGIQLSGMGSDGAQGLAKLRRAGAYTVVQTPETAAVDGMPRSAIALGAASAILRPEAIGELLRGLGSAVTRS